MNIVNKGAFNGFIGLKSALRTVTDVHSYRMDLGFALGLLQAARSKKVKFHVDAGGYRPAKLPREEWHRIVSNCRFQLEPRYNKGGVFHSKAWLFKRGVLLSSSNLSIREARGNLNFWCWFPGYDCSALRKQMSGGKSGTIILNLNTCRSILKNTTLQAIREAVDGNKIQNLIIITPQPPSAIIFAELAANMDTKGDCVLFLGNETHALKKLPGCGDWEVLNYVPMEKSIGLHGKAFYGEWIQDGKQSAILYIGSANFTKAAYSGDNLESGIVLKADGAKKVKELQLAVSALLGGSPTASSAEAAWATEKFNGYWELALPSEDSGKTKEASYQSADNIALSIFIQALKAQDNHLFFPAKYGDKLITSAELNLADEIRYYWHSRVRQKLRRFSGVIWSPDVTLKIRLTGGRNVIINIPPLEGLMGGIKEDAGLLELLLSAAVEPKEGSGGERKKLKLKGISIYSDARVLFPWQAISQNGHSRLMRNKPELKRTLHSVDALLKESARDNKITRKLNNIRFVLKCLLSPK